ncbi:CBS and ACT domain-containing protein [Gracilibacillus xinjiangensis]|uniref:CBS and ACT domain-containing protein n=1 Tax=Gracilibacillus xinjiangensis TaxID=1193282 RepID=A0ABV8WX44_9BACI
MLVKEIMKRQVFTLRKNNSIADAIKLFKEHHIRHIPVVNKSQHVIGIISDRDVRDASPSVLDKEVDQSLFNQSIDNIMTSPVITTHPSEYFEDVAAIFYEKEIACLPVTNKKLVGIITEKDMLYTFIQLTGTHSPSTQIEIKVPDRVGVLSDVSNLFSRRRIKIVSVYTYPSPNQSEYKIVSISNSNNESTYYNERHRKDRV